VLPDPEGFIWGVEGPKRLVCVIALSRAFKNIICKFAPPFRKASRLDEFIGFSVSNFYRESYFKTHRWVDFLSLKLSTSLKTSETKGELGRGGVCRRKNTVLE